MKNKKLITILLVVAISVTCLFAFTACGDKEDTGAAGYDGKLIVATNAAFPPFEMIDENGNYIGIDMEIAYAIGKILNYEVEIKDMEFDAVIAAVEAGTANIAMAGLTINATRLEQVDFCNPYYTANQVVITKSNSAIAQATNESELLSVLAGKKVGYQNGTVGEYYVKGDVDWGFDGITNVVATGYTNGAAAVLALNNGQIDAIVIDDLPAQNFVAANSGLVAMTSIPLTEEDYAFAIQKDDAEMKALINAAMIIIKEKGTFDTIVAKYFG